MSAPSNRLIDQPETVAPTGSSTPTSAVYVISVAIDDIVERLGPDVANQLDETIRETLRAICREHDAITTTGGSLMTISLEDVADDEMADRIGFRLYRAASIAADTVIPGAGELIRMGGARCLDGETTSEANRHAASALRSTAARGQRPVRTFSPTDRHNRRRELTVESMVRDAIRAGQITPHFQPVVELQGRAVAGFEALARIDRADAPPPSEFIPAAERLGLIDQLSALVLTGAFEAARDWPEQACISINVSELVLPDPRFVDRLSSAAGRANLIPGNILLEITESALVDSSTVVTRQIDALHAAGFRLAVDDYGAGHVSLRYLSEWPISFVKLDRTLTSEIGDPRVDVVVRSAIELAQELEITAIAKGVETPDQSEALHTWGCKLGQGYLFGRPTPNPQFSHLQGAAAS